MVNLVPPIIGVTLPPQLSVLSTSAGVFLISKAADDQLKSFFGE
jgi:hypothetical protein